MSDLVGSPEDQFSHNEAHIFSVQHPVEVVPRSGLPSVWITVVTLLPIVTVISKSWHWNGRVTTSPVPTGRLRTGLG